MELDHDQHEEEEEEVWVTLSELVPGAAIHNLFCRVKEVKRAGECTVESAHGTCTLMFDGNNAETTLQFTQGQVIKILNGFGSTTESGLLVLQLEDPEEEAFEVVGSDDMEQEDLLDEILPPPDCAQCDISSVTRVYGLLVLREDRILLLPDGMEDHQPGVPHKWCFPVHEAEGDEPERTAALRAFASLTEIDCNEVYVLNEVAPVMSYEEEFVSTLFTAYTRRPFASTTQHLACPAASPEPYAWFTYDQAIEALETEASKSCLRRLQASLEEACNTPFCKPSFGKRFGPIAAAKPVGAVAAATKPQVAVVPAVQPVTSSNEDTLALLARTSALFLLKERGQLTSAQFSQLLQPTPAAMPAVHVPLSVTVLSGFLGAGKTTLLNALLQANDEAAQSNKLRIAIIVNDMAEVNVDARMIVNQHADKDLVELTNGCICCSLRDDLFEAIKNMASTNAFDYLIVESTGVGDPLGVAETFSFPVNDKQILNDLARLDTLVTLVDCSTLKNDLMNSVSDLLTEQIEFSDVLVLTKTDLVNAQEEMMVRAMLAKLNPNARVISSVRGKGIALDQVLNTGLFDMNRASTYPGWLQSLKAPKQTETMEYGIGSVVFRGNLPFNSSKLRQALEQAPFTTDIIRSKGICYLDTQLGRENAVEWSGAGKRYEFSLGKQWSSAKGKCNEVVLIGFFEDAKTSQLAMDMLTACQVHETDLQEDVDGVQVKLPEDEEEEEAHVHGAHCKH